MHTWSLDWKHVIIIIIISIIIIIIIKQANPIAFLVSYTCEKPLQDSAAKSWVQACENNIILISVVLYVLIHVVKVSVVCPEVRWVNVLRIP
jgi:hypothetical protein